jgi:hypothetical protein
MPQTGNLIDEKPGFGYKLRYVRVSREINAFAGSVREIRATQPERRLSAKEAGGPEDAAFFQVRQVHRM